VVDTFSATILAIELGNCAAGRAVAARAPASIKSSLLAAAKAAVKAQRGLLAESEGDRVIACFVGRHADKASPLRALNCALAFVAAARKLLDAGSVRAEHMAYPIGCGVHTGMVTLARSRLGVQTLIALGGPAANHAQDIAHQCRLLRWTIAASASSLWEAEVPFILGREARLHPRDTTASLIIAEVVGSAARRERQTTHPVPPEPQHVAASLGLELPIAGRKPVRLTGRWGPVSSYEAVHLPTDRREMLQLVALNATPKGFWSRFEQTCRTLQDVRQRNVVEVIQTGSAEGMGYVVTEALPTSALSDAIAGGMAVSRILDCLAQLCMAIDLLHAEGVYVPDLRAEDILVREGKVFVLAGVSQIHRALQGWGAAPVPLMGRANDAAARAAADFRSLGRLVIEMLVHRAGGQRIHGAPRVVPTAVPDLPRRLAALQPLVSRLASDQICDGAEVISELLALKDRFPFRTCERDDASASYGATA
jgi:hypothetical protein